VQDAAWGERAAGELPGPRGAGGERGVHVRLDHAGLPPDERAGRQVLR